ncbi:ATP-binding protein [Bifidobacterium sp. ESL0704]|uniref:ATP-binding protein n=1 Tax=Bifidobacterium sp. ESL0704 TaxID=2983219 RepID=UPI0023F9AE4C|nr:ATP-binding protein [Bifidobacterium sp. ESL0704]WEV52751.1 ATP-binding protein [Bifidobacterium sp. ESL0704]
MVIERLAYLERIKPYVGKNIIKVLTGVRRSGKSTLLYLLKRHMLAQGASEANMLHLRFESAQLADVKNDKDLTQYVYEHIDPKKPICLFLDEIQEVEHWERALRAFMVDCDADIYITGSNASVLSSDLATFITGRYVTIEVFPLSFKEFEPAYRVAHPKADNREAFRAYVVQGGFPFQNELDFDQDASLHYLDDLFSTILLKDVVKRNDIRDVDMLERIVRYAVAEEGHLLTTKRISDYLKSEQRKVSAATVTNYLEAATQAYLLYRVRREDAVGKKMLSFNDKYYVVDQGLRQALGLNNVANVDQVLEGIVYTELLRRGYKVNVGKVGDAEVDFIVRRNGETEYYQVSYLVADEQTRNREFGVLAKINDNYRKTVLSLDEFPYSVDGIRGVNLVDWLLE